MPPKSTPGLPACPFADTADASRLRVVGTPQARRFQDKAGRVTPALQRVHRDLKTRRGHMGACELPPFPCLGHPSRRLPGGSVVGGLGSTPSPARTLPAGSGGSMETRGSTPAVRAGPGSTLRTGSRSDAGRQPRCGARARTGREGPDGAEGARLLTARGWAPGECGRDAGPSPVRPSVLAAGASAGGAGPPRQGPSPAAHPPALPWLQAPCPLPTLPSSKSGRNRGPMTGRGSAPGR